MGIPLVLPLDLIIQGVCAPATLNIPASTILDAAVNANAGIQASKLQHQYSHNKSDDFSTTTAVERSVVHTVYGATGTLLRFGVGVTTAAIGAATVTVDLKKNGITILTATITIDSTLAANAVRTGTFVSTGLVAADVLELHITAAVAGGGTLPKGFFSQLILREDPQ
jgi:hypothetical protein